jgi:hypothetical protein
MSMPLLRKWTEPSPKRNGTPSRCGLEVEAASNTPGVFGPVTPAWRLLACAYLGFFLGCAGTAKKQATERDPFP